jgi:hypothetical protein
MNRVAKGSRMSKRKSRKNSKPNLPEETLERARQEAGLAPKREEPETEAEEVEEIEISAPVMSIPQPEAPRRRETLAQPVKRKARPRRPANYEEMTPEDVAYALEHPTKIVTEESLREQYGYVLADLRSMGILATGLFVALIAIAAVIIR